MFDSLLSFLSTFFFFLIFAFSNSKALLEGIISKMNFPLIIQVVLFQWKIAYIGTRYEKIHGSFFCLL